MAAAAGMEAAMAAAISAAYNVENNGISENGVDESGNGDHVSAKMA